MRRRLGTTLALLSVLFSLGVVLAPVASAHPYCGQAWGSRPESSPGMSAGAVYDVRTGRHACFDRLVLDVDRPLVGWSVRYVDRIKQDGSGRIVPVRGGEQLEVVARVRVRPGTFTGPGSIADTSGYRTFRDVTLAGSFEGVTTVGLGVRARLPFRAFVLSGPGSGSRLVVDVGHRWCAPGHRRC